MRTMDEVRRVALECAARMRPESDASVIVALARKFEAYLRVDVPTPGSTVFFCGTGCELYRGHSGPCQFEPEPAEPSRCAGADLGVRSVNGCSHLRADHGEFGCTAHGCPCQRPGGR